MQQDELHLHPDQIERLTAEATKAAAQAYAPYSNFRVGAALLLPNATIITGANVENASYGLTICAERAAITRAIIQQGPDMRVLACAIANLNQAASPPCGACLQVLSEFMSPAAQVIFPGERGSENYRFEQMFPHRFQLRSKP